MPKAGVEERRKYEIRKYNFRTDTGITLEVYPKKIKGLTNAIRLIEELDAKLSEEEKADGVSWYHHP
jgi:hypothetical protein